MLFCCSLDSQLDLIDIAATLPQQYPYLLDSADSGPLGNTSILFRPNGQHLCLHKSGEITGPGEGNSFLPRLEAWFQQDKITGAPLSSTPFKGGWFVYLGYELAEEIEPVVQFPASRDEFPIAFASRCPAAILLNNNQPGVLHLLAEDEATLEQMRRELESLQKHQPHSSSAHIEVNAEPPAIFKQSIQRIHEYILDGDVFQVNLSREWNGKFDQVVEPAGLYRSLRQSNPAPFAGWVQWGDAVLMSSSPERLVEINNGVVQSRPIAGTHPRGADSASDAVLSKQMLAHPKERAEHIMLIDLERNDLGRVCQTGTVEVDELMVVESYQHVHHIVSNVRGILRDDVSPVDVIRAVFPGGTITGCPKVRCMQIIAELEQHGRSFYTGSMGYLGLDGNMDLNILIRSMLLHENQISFRTGAGIVADSDPERELAETHYKARGLLRALGDLHA